MNASNKMHKRYLTAPRRALRRWGGVLALAALLVPARAVAADTALIRSLVIPGAGQAHSGHYTRAAIFAGSAVLSGFGIIISKVYYDEAVEKYRDLERLYASYEETRKKGEVVSFEEIQSTYASMQAAHDACENRLAWRNAFVAAFVATYAVNVVDILVNKADPGDANRPLSLEVGQGGFRVTKAFRF